MQVFTPDKVLDPYIECYWSWHFCPEERELDAILPDAAPEFIVHFGLPPLSLQDSGEWLRQPRSFVICAAHRSIRLAVDGPVDLFAIRFRPWGISRFAHRSMADFLDREVLPDALFGSSGILLSDKITGAADDESRVHIANSMLRRWLDEDPARDEMFRKLHSIAVGGQTKGREIAKILGISDRSFRRLWHEVVGIEQRKFASLMRFHRAISMIDSGQKLAAIAVDCGYSDQSHLARDIKSISGLPPTLLRNRLGTEVYQDLYADRPSAPWRSNS